MKIILNASMDKWGKIVEIKKITSAAKNTGQKCKRQ